MPRMFRSRIAPLLIATGLLFTNVTPVQVAAQFESPTPSPTPTTPATPVTPTTPTTPPATVPATPPASLANFPLASELLADKQVTGKSLAQGKAFVYKIEVLPAKQLRIFAQGHSSSQQAELTLSIYTENGTLLARAPKNVFGDISVEAFYYKGFLEAGLPTEPVYIEFQNTSTDTAAAITYNFIPTFAVLSDTQQGFDASDAIPKSTALIAGSYKLNHIGQNLCGVNQYCSTDEKDTYAIAVKAKEQVSLTVTPQVGLSLNVDISDVEKKSLKKVVVTQTTATPIVVDAVDDGVLYLTISGDASKDYFGTYDMALSIEAATVEQPIVDPPTVLPPPASDEGLSLESIMQYAQDNVLVVAGIGIGFLFVIIILILLLRRRKRKKLMKAAQMGQAQDGGFVQQPIQQMPQAQVQSQQRPATIVQPQARRPLTRTPEAPRDPNAQAAQPTLNPTDFSFPEDGAQPPLPPQPPQGPQGNQQ